MNVEAVCQIDDYRGNGVDHSSFALKCESGTKSVTLREPSEHGKILEENTFNVIHEGEQMQPGKRYYFVTNSKWNTHNGKRDTSEFPKIKLEVNVSGRKMEKMLQVLTNQLK